MERESARSVERESDKCWRERDEANECAVCLLLNRRLCMNTRYFTVFCKHHSIVGIFHCFPSPKTIKSICLCRRSRSKADIGPIFVSFLLSLAPACSATTSAAIAGLSSWSSCALKYFSNCHGIRPNSKSARVRNSHVSSVVS